ncbi:MAG TPA: TIGR00282 family metallophosphoesterase, partial [Planctomycetia bacterium]|nr:TIGR00282 family metallophosphoesterase [Planctomycetia bacterium]
MRVLFLGDIVGEPGRKIVREAAPILRRRYACDAVFANAENCAGGSGITGRCHSQLAAAGLDALTMGDHIYRRREVMDLFGRTPPICKPGNFPAEAPGPDRLLVTLPSGVKIGVISLLGRTFMRPVDCPFHAADRLVAELRAETPIIFVDMHAEATSEKQAMLRHLLGRVTAVLGTHTHVPTADATIYPPGTAYMTDLGMTGPYDGVIGRRWEPVLKHAITFEHAVFEVAEGDP